jgi:membrane-associated protease RseP (regulator of RpoE activity)
MADPQAVGPLRFVGVARGVGRGVLMRPKISVWSDYGIRRHKRWRSPSRQRSQSSIGPRILVAAVVVVAGVIGISCIYSQIIDSEWVLSVGTHVKRTAVAHTTTTRRPGIVAAIPSSPRRVATTTGDAVASEPRAAPPPPATAGPPEGRTSVAAAELSSNEAAPLSAIPDGQVMADPPSERAPTATPEVKPADRYVARAPATAVGAGNQGVAVTAVDPSGPAADHGMQSGDVILDVGGKAVSSPADVSKEIADLDKAGKHTVLMRVKSNNGIKFVAM